MRMLVLDESDPCYPVVSQTESPERDAGTRAPRKTSSKLYNSAPTTRLIGAGPGAVEPENPPPLTPPPPVAGVGVGTVAGVGVAVGTVSVGAPGIGVGVERTCVGLTTTVSCNAAVGVTVGRTTLAGVEVTIGRLPMGVGVSVAFAGVGVSRVGMPRPGVGVGIRPITVGIRLSGVGVRRNNGILGVMMVLGPIVPRILNTGVGKTRAFTGVGAIRCWTWTGATRTGSTVARNLSWTGASPSRARAKAVAVSAL